MSDQTDLASSLVDLRSLLRQLPPSGEAGFEGLIATLIADLTGLQIRLAKSGTQFGRDASSPKGRFAIAIEAKRYDASLRLEDLIGKAVLAGSALGTDTDLWVLGATSEVGDDVVRKISEIIGSHGMSVVFLDWSPRPIPPLAVLLASRPESTAAWFARYAPATDTTRLSEALTGVINAHAFAQQSRILLTSLSASHIGLEALRCKNRMWLRERWTDPLVSRQEFSQIVTPLDPSRVTLTGRASRLGLETLITPSFHPTVVAILGEEGLGKTWLVCDWWISTPDPPILIPILGRAVEFLDTRNALDSLARVLALHYNEDNVDHVGWRRRLQRWSERGPSATDSPWIVVVLDGLNERMDLPWADILVTFGKLISEIGGVLIATCRPSFWTREIVPRLADPLHRAVINVPGYKPSEVEHLLRSHNFDPEVIPIRLKDFLRNPRVCSVALYVLNELAGATDELTIERLQLEYWKQRMRERGNLVQHTAEDFHNLLKAHAREWLSHPKRQFQLDDWMEKSALLKRSPAAAIVNDLSDIVEGRFMRPSPHNEGTYEFRPEALSFALGLLLAQEIRGVQDTDGRASIELIENLLEPIRGFDSTSNIVCGAFGLSCIDESFPAIGRRALLTTWASLQNLNKDALQAMFPYTSQSPDVFCDVLERLHTDKGYHPHESTLAEFLFLSSEHPKVRSVLRMRIPVWLSFWCRKSLPFPNQKEPSEKREAVAGCLGELTLIERKTFLELCHEVAGPEAAHADDLAAFQMLSGSQASLVSGIWAWSLTQAIAADYSNAGEDLGWAIRLNPFDWFETSSALNDLVDSVSTENSTPYRTAAAMALRLLGDLKSETKAENFAGPRFPGESWQRIKTFCNTNPHDPEASICDNLQNARTIVESLTAENLRTGRFSTKEDHDFADAMPALARFSIDSLTRKIREVVSTIESRSGMALLALSWDLPEYSATLDNPTISAVERALHRFLEENNDWFVIDNQLIVNQSLRTIFPHLTASRQLEVLLKLPEPITLFLTVRGTLKPLTAEGLDTALEDPLVRENGYALERVLFMVSANPINYSQKSRQVIAVQLESSSKSMRNVAYDLIARSGDPQLNDALIGTASSAPVASDHDGETFYQSQAIAAVIAAAGRPELLELVDADLRQSVAAEVGGEAITIIASQIDESIDRLLQPIAVCAEPQAPITIGSTPNGLMQRISTSDDEGETDIRKSLTELSDPEATARQFNQDHRMRVQQHRDFEQRLADEGGRAFLHVPARAYMVKLVEACPQRVEHWLRRILLESREEILRQVFNLGAGLAGAYAKVHGALAASVLRHLEGRQPFFRVVSDPEQIPLYLTAVFSESSSAEMSLLRERILAHALNDATVELCARAASSCGSRVWLLDYINEHHLGENPAMQARAMTLAGFCYPEEELSYVFANDRRTGFLGKVRAYALKQRTRALWAKHWCDSAIAAQRAVDFWRFGKLAEGVVDLRFTRCFEGLPSDRFQIPFEAELYERLYKAAEAGSKKRKDTLFGVKAPSDRIVWAYDAAFRRKVDHHPSS